MVFFSVRVGNFLIKYQPFSDDDEQYPIVDKDKNLLEYVKGTRTNGYYINPTTKEPVNQTFMLVNNEVKEKFERTKETDKFKIVENNEIADLINPKMYIVECENLKAELRANGKALKFGISFGGKSKPYYAIICLNPIYNTLEMWISIKTALMLNGAPYSRKMVRQGKGWIIMNIEKLLLMNRGGLKMSKINDLMIPRKLDVLCFPKSTFL